MYVDFKITTWERIRIPEDEESKIKDGLITGELISGDDVFNALDVGNVEFIDGVPSEQMDVSENDGQSTIELYNDGGDMLWNNETIKIEDKDE